MGQVKIQTFKLNDYPEINEKYITTTYFHRDKFKSYIDSSMKKIGYCIVGIFGISSSVASLLFYIVFLQWLSIIILISYVIILALIISYEKASSMHRWNIRSYIIIFFLIAFGNQILAIIMFLFNPISLIKFIFLTLGTSWAPACLTIFVLYITREYVNLIGRIHLLLGWIYKIGDKKKESYSIMKIAHLYFHNYLLELETLLDRKVNLVISNIPEILTSLYTAILESNDHLNSIISTKEELFLSTFKELYNIKEKEQYERSSNDFIGLLIKITKEIAGINKIEIKYVTIKMKIKRILGKSIKYLIPVITSIISLLLKLIF